MAILLEERVDTRDTTVPAILEILESETAVLRVRLLSLHRVLRPDTGRVHELSLPRLQVAVQVGDELVLLVRHTGAEVGDCRKRASALKRTKTCV